jgi:hypothetical protein
VVSVGVLDGDIVLKVKASGEEVGKHEPVHREPPIHLIYHTERKLSTTIRRAA